MSQFKPLPPLRELQQKFEYDPASGALTNKCTRSGRAVKGNLAGSLKPDGYIHVCLDRRMLKAHRIIWYIVTGTDPVGFDVDHIDRNPLNNSWVNLRLATRTQNNANSKNKGYQKRGNSYRAKIKIGKQQVSLGSFPTPEEAHEVYKAKHIEVHGSFSPYFQ